jgi:hypothetical protein
LTALTELKAISLTGTAKNAASAKGVDLPALVAQAQLHITELSTILKQVIAFHPTSGGDAANLSALNAVLAELA